MLIFFEGVDKTGKSSLAREVLKRTNYKHVVFDRGIISQIVYDKMFKRESDKEIKNAIEFLKMTNHIFFLCEAKEETIRKRLNEVNEKLPKELDDINEVKKEFMKTIYESGLKFHFVDTDESFEDTISFVLKKIGE